MTIQIRSAVPGEAQALSDIARRAKASWGYPQEWLEQWREALTVTEEYLRLHRSWVAVSGDLIVAWCALEISGTVASIGHLWVDPDAQGQRVGRHLMEHALDAARQAAMCRVRVDSDPHATGFYASLGAERAGSIPAPMPGAPDRVLPVLEFTVGAP